MEEENLGHWVWIANYLTGNISAEEQRSLSDWIKADPENRVLFEQTLADWQLSSRVDTPYQPDVERGWMRFKQTVSLDTASVPETTPAPRIIRFRPVPVLMRVAAAVLILITTVYLFQQLSGGEEPALVARVAQDQKLEVQLPDGSTVLLNRNSRISYPENFAGTDRIVHLSGEAFFNVSKQNGKSFIVYTGDTKTQVLGTSFNVKWDSSRREVAVTVLSGRVAFSRKDAPEEQIAYLGPGEKGVQQAGEPGVKVQAPDDLNFLAWKEDKLVFTNTRIDQVARTLEDYFDVRIRLTNPRLAACRFTGQFENPQLAEVLEVLALSVNLTYALEYEQYQLSGEGCE